MIMKRYIIHVCIIMLLFCGMFACKATPDEDYVVNKKDTPIEEIVSETANQDSIQEFNQSIPDHWNEKIDIGRFSFIFDVDVERLQSESYPAYKTTTRKFSSDEIHGIFSNLLGMSYQIRTWERARQDIEMEMLSTANSRELLGDEQCDQILENLQNEMDHLGSEPVFVPSKAYTLQLPEKVEATNGDKNIYASLEENSVIIWENTVGAIQLYAWLEDEVYAMPEISEDDALLIGLDVLKQINANGFSLAQSEPGRVLALYENKTLYTGWDLVFTRTEGSYLGFDPNSASQGLLVFDDTQYSQPLPQETIELFVSETGCCFISWNSPTATIETAQENTQPLLFNVVRDDIIKWLAAGYSWRQDKIGLSNKMYVNRVFLSCATIQAKDEIDVYFTVPVWILVYQEENDINTPVAPTYIAINALDGSRIQY